MHSSPPGRANGSSWNVAGTPKIGDNKAFGCCAVLCPRRGLRKVRLCKRKRAIQWAIAAGGRSSAGSSTCPSSPQGQFRHSCTRHLLLESFTCTVQGLSKAKALRCGGLLPYLASLQHVLEEGGWWNRRAQQLLVVMLVLRRGPTQSPPKGEFHPHCLVKAKLAGGSKSALSEPRSRNKRGQVCVHPVM